MKTCPNCGASQPDFAKTCSKCDTAIPAAAGPVGAQPTGAVRQGPSPGNTAPLAKTPPKSTPATVNISKKKGNLPLIIGGVVAILVIVIWFLVSKSSSDEARVAKAEARAEAAAEIAKAKAEAAEATSKATEAEQQAAAAKDAAEKAQQSATQNNAAPATNNPLLARASKCTVSDCLGILILAAQPRNPEAIQVAAGRYGEFNTLKTGDRPAARDLNNKGLAQLRAGNANGAIDLFARAVSADPNDSEVVGNLAYALIQVGRLDEADKFLSAALVINPRRTATWGALAEFFAKKPNNTENAVRSLQLGYEFSGNREKTLQFFTDNASTSDRPEMRPVYAEAARRIRANY